jgi:hypothetical protein
VGDNSDVAKLGDVGGHGDENQCGAERAPVIRRRKKNRDSELTESRMIVMFFS